MASGQGGAKETLIFVDAVEEDQARLLLGEEAFTAPVALLPDGAREGSWLRLSLVVVPPPVDPDARRGKLAGGDDGGPIKL